MVNFWAETAYDVHRRRPSDRRRASGRGDCRPAAPPNPAPPAERTLRESEERFRLIADRAPVMMWTARPDTTLDFLNNTCVEFTGLTLDQLLDEGWLTPCTRRTWTTALASTGRR